MGSKMTTRAAKRPPKGDTETDETVYTAILDAILAGRLVAGTKLAETPLAELFGVSRERIRKVLHRLVAERRLEAVTNRGVRVPCPTPDDVRAIYQAHRVLEAGILVELARTLDDALIGRLEAHVAQERRAAAEGDRAASVRLSGQFHLLIADSLDNAELSAGLRDLLSRSSVMVSVFEAAADSICGANEHAAIVEALRARDTARAIALSGEHFRHIETRLRLKAPSSERPDLAAVFAVPGAKAP